MNLHEQARNRHSDQDDESAARNSTRHDSPVTPVEDFPAEAAPGAPAGRVGALDRWLAKKLLQHLGHPGIRVKLWDQRPLSANRDEILGTLRFHDRGALYKTLTNPELNWGDLYGEGRVDVDGDLVRMLETVYRCTQQDKGSHWLERVLNHRTIRNTLRRAADNIHHHYDIGNDFYSLWLDTEAMQYTCAYYPEPEMDLEAAQAAKMEHVCRKLQLKPGDKVVEAGCGWGGFALYMAQHHGVEVTAYNISREQVKYARDKVRERGLSDRVRYVLDDYRNIEGDYDVFVSVGMLEHVGPLHYRTLGEVIKRCLRPDGRGLIHSIGRNRPKPINAWIERRIFPGAYPPTLREMMDIFEPSGLSVLDVENLRLHYARTLAAWLERFDAHVDEIRGMLDERFARCWRLYLAGSQAAFTTGQLQLFQVLFAHEDNNALPWSRAHVYADA